MDNTKGMVVGAAIGTLIGSIAIALYPKRKEILRTIQNQSNTIARKTRAASGYLTGEIPTIRRERKNYFLKGSLLGMLAGAGTTWLLTPFSKKRLRNQISRVYNGMATKAQEALDFSENNFTPTKKSTNVLKPRRKRPHSDTRR